MTSELQDMLPIESKYLKESQAAQPRVKASNNLTLWIESENAQSSANLQLDLANAINAAGISIVQNAEMRVGDEAEFFKSRAALFIAPEELEQFEASISKKKTPLNKLLGDVKELLFAKKWTSKFSSFISRYTRFKDGVYASADGKTRVIIVRVYSPAGNLHLQTALDVQRAIDEVVAKVKASRAEYGAVNIRYTGNLRHLIEDHESLYRDIELSTAVVVILVGLSLILYFRSFKDLFYLALSLSFGMLLCFGLASLIFKPMNANAAFMMSIVIGNGINFGIILLTRLRETGNISTSISDVKKPTLLAAGAGVIAYGSLAVTDFRGFQQFGIMGVIGMLSCWVSAMVMIPVLVLLVEKTPKQWSASKEAFSMNGSFEAKLKKNAKALVILLVLICLWAGIVSKFSFQYETDLIKVRDARSYQNGSLQLAAKLESLLGMQMTPMLVLTSSREQTKAIVERLDKAKLVPNFISLDQLVPKNQNERIKAAKSFVKRTENIPLESLSTPNRALLSLIRESTKNLHPFEEKDLPPSVLKMFEEINGERGRMVLLETTRDQQNNLKDIKKLVGAIREFVRGIDPGAIIVGTQQLAMDLCEAVETESKKVASMVFVFIVLSVFVAYRNFKTCAWILGSWMLALAVFGAWIVLSKTKLNMINFLAIPITVGIGIDYAVNFYSRLKTEQLWTAFKAVGLCSLTTCIGYLSLLTAGNMGLRSFGALAFVGEVICLFLCLLWGILKNPQRS